MSELDIEYHEAAERALDRAGYLVLVQDYETPGGLVDYIAQEPAGSGDALAFIHLEEVTETGNAREYSREEMEAMAAAFDTGGRVVCFYTIMVCMTTIGALTTMVCNARLDQ